MIRTVILPFVGDLPQFRNALELGIKIQYILTVEALARLDKLQVILLELAKFDNAFLSMLLKLIPH